MMKFLLRSLTLAITAAPFWCALAQAEDFDFVGGCGVNWYDCCALGETDRVNNWDVPPTPSPDCPPYPGEFDHVDLGDNNAVLLDGVAPAPVTIASLHSDGSVFELSKSLTVTGGPTVLYEFTQVNSVFDPGLVLDVFGPWHWKGGEVAGPGTATSNVALELESNGNHTLTGRTLISLGPVSWTGTGNIVLNEGAVFENRNAMEILNNEWISGGAGGGRFWNRSTVTKLGSPGETLFFGVVTLDNDGTVQILDGQITVESPGTCTGTYHLEPGTTMRINTLGNSEFVFDGAADFTGSGLVRVTGGGPLRMTASTNVTVENLEMAGGPINNAGAFEIASLAWTSGGGDFLGSGTTTVTTSNLMTGPSRMLFAEQTFDTGPSTIWSDGNIVLDQDAELRNGGSFVIQDGADFLDFWAAGAGTVSNPAGSTMTFETASVTISGVGSTDGGVIDNGGVMEFQGTSARIQSGVHVLNTGLFHVQTGEVRITNQTEYLQTDGTTLVDEGALFWSTNIATFLGGSIEGKGTVRLSQGFVNDGVRIEPGASPGTLFLDSDYAQSGDASLEIELSGTADGEFDLLSVAGDVTLGGELEVVLVDGFEPSVGESFVVITGASVSGEFETITTVDFPANLGVQVIVGEDAVSILILEATSSLPDQDPEVSEEQIVSDLHFSVGPNPATSGVTQISLHLATPSVRAQIEVLDVGGRIVGKVMDGPLASGVHRMQWDGRSERGETISSGTYFVRVVTERGARSKRVILIH